MLNLIKSTMPILAQADPNSTVSLQERTGETFELGEVIMTKCSELLAQYGFRILGAILILVLGRYVAICLTKLTNKTMAKAQIDPLLINFTANLTYVALLVFVVMAALETLAIKTVGIAAVIAAAGLAIGLALQGSLSNFAAGALMIIFKPIRVGDFVEVGGVKGKVQEIQIFNTILNTPDNIRVIVPNSQVTGGSIRNYNTNSTRRVDMVIGVSYDDDLKKARDVMEKVLSADDRILQDPAPTIAVSELADSSVNFVVRPWVKTENYWDVYFDLTEKIKVSLDKNNITIPFPQRDIHVKTPISMAAKS